MPHQGCVAATLLAATALAGCGAAGEGSTQHTPDGGGAGAESGAVFDAPPETGLPNPADFADVSVDVSFAIPAWLPAPDTTVTGDATNLLGSWVEMNADGTQCTPSRTDSSYQGTVCTHLDIQKGADGLVTGTIYRDAQPGANMVAGPFAPATDPNVGYPTTASPDDYFVLRTITAGVRYRVLDGAIAGDAVTFWFSPYDLWSDWCALQTAYPWTVNGEQAYRCIPQIADASAIDLGKRALCSSAFDGPMCSWTGGDQPCICLDDGGNFVAGPLCGGPVCECSASACRAELRDSVLNATFTLEGDKLVGFLDVEPPTVSGPTTLQRVAP